MKRRILFWILILAFGWVLIGRYNEIGTLIQTLRGGRWPWVALAAALQFAYYATTSWLYQVSFTAVGVKTRWRNLIALTFAAVFVNSTAPSGGAAGVALYVDEANRRGQSGPKAVVGTLLVLVADFGAFLLLLTAALITLFASHNLLTYEIVTGSIMYLYVGGMAGLLALGLWRPASLLRVLQAVQRLVNGVGGWFRNPTLVREGWAEHNADEFAASAQTMAAQPRQLLRVLGVALLTHALDMASLFALFRAFNVAATIGVVIAGYSMTMLFWIVSPTPNGIGVVEGLMPLVYTSLGLPTAAATVITLAFRGLTFWIPFLVGFALLRRLPIFAAPQRGLARLGQVRLIAVFTGAMGLLNVLSASTPALADRAALLERFSPLMVTRGGNLAAVLAGFALLVLAYQLTQRKQIAWFATLAVLSISALSHLLKGLDYEEALLAALLAFYLLMQRRYFQARSDPPSLRQGINALFAGLAFTLAYGTTGFYLLDRHYSINFSLDAALRQTVVMFTQFYDPGLQPITGFGRYFANSIYGVAGVTLVYGAVQLSSSGDRDCWGNGNMRVKLWNNTAVRRWRGLCCSTIRRTGSALVGRWWGMGYAQKRPLLWATPLARQPMQRRQSAASATIAISRDGSQPFTKPCPTIWHFIRRPALRWCVPAMKPLCSYLPLPWTAKSASHFAPPSTS